MVYIAFGTGTMEYILSKMSIFKLNEYIFVVLLIHNQCIQHFVLEREKYVAKAHIFELICEPHNIHSMDKWDYILICNDFQRVSSTHTHTRNYINHLHLINKFRIDEATTTKQSFLFCFLLGNVVQKKV